MPTDAGQQQALADALAPHCFVRSVSEANIVIVYVAPFSDAGSGGDVSGVRVELFECDRAFLVTPRPSDAREPASQVTAALWQRIEQCYRQSFVSAVYAQVTDSQSVSRTDLDRALSTCEEHTVMVRTFVLLRVVLLIAFC